MIITNLMSNMVVVSLGGGLPANTPAFQEYASGVLLSNAAAISQRIGLPKGQFARENITAFSADPFLDGPTVAVSFGNRFVFSSRMGTTLRFMDLTNYSVTMFSSNPVHDDARKAAEIRGAYLRLANSPNHLNKSSALKLAWDAVKAFGVETDKLPAFSQAPEFEQLKFTDANDVSALPDGSIQVKPKEKPVEHELPYYTFEWRNTAPFASCNVHVSGAASNVVYFFYAGPGARFPKPANYLQLLGYDTNTVFVSPTPGGAKNKSYMVVKPRFP